MAEDACQLLEARGHAVIRLKEKILQDSPDPLVAKVAQDHDAILLTHDSDFRRIAPRIATGERRHFLRLSKVHLNCEHARGVDRLAAAIALIEFEFETAFSRRDKRVHVSVGLNVIRTHR